MFTPNLVKEIDVDFLKAMNRAELVKLVMDRVEDEGLVVVGRVVAHDVMDCIGREEIHNLNPAALK